MCPAKKQTLPRWPNLLVAGLLWFSIVCSILLFILFALGDIWRPHIFWWWATVIPAVSLALIATFLVIRNLWFGDRTWALGIFLLTLAPLVWFATYIWWNILILNQRGDLQLNLPKRSLGLWVGSYFELEARFRYPRITDGDYVQLFDDGSTPNAEKLVSQMDRHVEQMALKLGTAPPQTRIRWVRGSIFGQSGRAIGAWALCSNSDRQEGIQSLDKHEVAHCLITLSCSVDQDMPMLFAEGWAQTQSNSKAKEVLKLLELKEAGNSQSLSKIVCEHYGQSIGPAYSHGGPLVWYMLEKFGGPKFLELYGNVRRSTFESDIVRLLDVDWSQLEDDFWAWLDSKKDWAEVESAKLAAADEAIIFEREIDEERWTKVLDALRMQRKSQSRPDAFAIECVMGGEVKSVSTLIVEGLQAWRSLENESIGKTTYERITESAQVKVESKTDGSSRIVSQSDFDGNSPIRFVADFWFNRHQLSNAFQFDLLDLSTRSDQELRIHSIQPGDAPLSPWEFQFTQIYENHSEKHTVFADPTRHFELVSISSELADDSRNEFQFEVDELFGLRALTGLTGQINGRPYHNRLRALSIEEATKKKAKIEAAIQNATPMPKQKIESPPKLVSVQFQPWMLAVGWPSLAVVLLCVDALCNRFRFQSVATSRPSDY